MALKFKLHFIQVFIVLIVLTPNIAKMVKKRQLFREQLLPNLGGKVPESAFWSERLALNQLNSRGIYSSTGIYLEHGHNKPHPHGTSIVASTMQVRVPQEDRFVAAPGRYYFDSPTTVDTTYLIRDPISIPIRANLLHQTHPLIPYTSLKLTRYYNQKKVEKNKESPWNDVENTNDFATKAKKEYEPYLKKLHEVDK